MVLSSRSSNLYTRSLLFSLQRHPSSLIRLHTMAGQILCEKICLELPQVLVQFVNLSTVCQALCLNIIEALLESCNAREIFAVLMEVFY